MNEELKIIISAVTGEAEKGIKSVQKGLNGIGGSAKGSSTKFGAAMGAIGKSAALAAGAVAAAFAAIGGAMLAAEKSSREYREEQAKLNSAFVAAGSSANQAKETYNGLFRFLGESDRAGEAAAHLAQLTTSQEELAQWTKICQGVYATFGDSLPIEGLTEAANETAKVGQVTGTLADALNWAGVNEDAFNASLAACNSEAEREELIRSTLNGLYDDAAKAYEEANAAMIAQNEAQSKLSDTMASIGEAALPLVTALTNLANTILAALAPALNAIVPYLVNFVNMISQAVQWTLAFINALTGGNKAVDATKQIATNTAKIASGAKNTKNNFNAANKEAEKLKRTTQGFDELNILGKVDSGASASGSNSGSLDAPGAIAGGGSFDTSVSGSATLDTTNFEASINRVLEILQTFKTNIQLFVQELAIMFDPAIDGWVLAFQKLPESWAGMPEVINTAWSGMIETMAAAWDEASPRFLEGTNQFSLALSNILDYVMNVFAPEMITAFVENIAPVITDIFGFGLEEAGKNWEFFGTKLNQISTDIIIPAIDFVKGVYTDLFTIIKEVWDEYGDPILTNFGDAFDDIRTKLDTFYNECFKPVWDKLMEGLDYIWVEYLKPLVKNVLETLADIGNNLLILYNEFIAPVLDWILKFIYPVVVDVAESIMEYVGIAIKGIKDTIDGLLLVIKGIIRFITGVFTGDWDKAWQGVKDIFTGIWNTLEAAIKNPLNLIIGSINALLSAITTAVNTIIKGINKLSWEVPDWVPVIGGETFGFDIPTMKEYQIPLLATGGIVNDGTLAMVGENGKEAVLPLERNTEWMDMLAARLYQNQASKIILTIDGKELGWASINSINSITKQTGSLQLSMV